MAAQDKAYDMRGARAPRGRDERITWGAVRGDVDARSAARRIDRGSGSTALSDVTVMTQQQVFCELLHRTRKRFLVTPAGSEFASAKHKPRAHTRGAVFVPADRGGEQPGSATPKAMRRRSQANDRDRSERTGGS
jgi:hypothetical protein